MLTLLLFVALLTIAAAVAAPSIAFQIKREREEELIHRGVQYSRAIRSFAKKTGRYPNTLEQLRDTGGVRVIRKLYKDPITGGDFRLLHAGDVSSPVTPPNLNASQGQNGDSGSSGGASSQGDSAPASAPAPSSTEDPQSNSTSARSAPAPNINQVGQVIFGIASRSKSKTIREFDHKNHYNEWLFFYEPSRDRGTEIKGPTSLTPLLSLQGGATSNQTQPEQQQ